MSSRPPSLRVQVVLFGQAAAEISRLTWGVAAAARVALDHGRAASVTLALGDSSPAPRVARGDLDRLATIGDEGGMRSLTYEFFGANLGSSGGSNRLALSAEDDFILVLNPDTYPSPTLFSRMLAAFLDPSLGAADARQIPLDHPKHFDPVTGDTSWVSGSCLLTPTDVFEAVAGFDAEHFPLYCDDVDFSWRVRLKGFRTVHVAGAVVFHDKRIASDGHVRPTPVEAYHTGLGRLMLAKRYGRPDVVEETLQLYERSGGEGERAALTEWRRRLELGAVPDLVQDADRVAQFVAGDFGPNRF